MGKRIYEVAKEIGKPVNEILEILKKHDIKKSNFSAADDKDIELIKKAYAPPAPKTQAQSKSRPAAVSGPQRSAGAQTTAQRRPSDGQGITQRQNAGVKQPLREGAVLGQGQARRGNLGFGQGQRRDNIGGQRPQGSSQNQRPQSGNFQRQGGQAQPRRDNPGFGQGQRRDNIGGQRPQGSSQNQRPQGGNFQRQGGAQTQPRRDNTGFSQGQRQQGGSFQRQGSGVQGQRPSGKTRPQGGIFVGPSQGGAGQAKGREERERKGRRENSAKDNEHREGGKNAGKSRKNQTPLKGSYATKESRPNRSAGHQMPINRNKKPNQPKPAAPVEILRPASVEIGEAINVQDFAKLIKREVNEVIKALFMLGVPITINQDIDFDTALLVGSEFSVEVLAKAPEEDPTEIPEVEDPEELRVARPPVITVMGHVDHGKTSILDAIRKTNVTAREAGGITQHIGAYKVNYQGKQIVFLDTPGHEAFTAMRARGAQVTDIAILVVAADDGVMPQTIEAINHAKAAKVPIIVAINKMDRASANPEHVKQQLSEHELIPEDWGGDTIMVPCSAHSKEGITNLLEMVLLVADMQELKANPALPAHGTIIEAQLDKGRGPVATVLVQRGTLRVGDTIIAGTTYGKVRAMVNDLGEKVKKATPSTPVEVLGLNDVPQAGDILDCTEEHIARSVAEKRIARKKEAEIATTSKVSLDDLFQRIKEGKLKELNIVVKADVQGTIEALQASLEKIKNDEVKVVIVHAGVGAITESDVMLASAANALIIGFNVRPDTNARKSAELEKVDLRTYRVIYDAINDVEAAIKGMLAPKFTEVVLGRVEVRQLITISKLLIAGCYVLEGKVTNNSKVRIIRDGIVLPIEDEVDSLRRFKDDVKEVLQGFECGITLAKYRDLKEGDIFEVYAMQEVTAE